jgi:hypothetical protein
MAAMRNGGTADLVNARNIHLDVVDGEHGRGILPWDVLSRGTRFCSNSKPQRGKNSAIDQVRLKTPSPLFLEGDIWASSNESRQLL